MLAAHTTFWLADTIHAPVYHLNAWHLMHPPGPSCLPCLCAGARLPLLSPHSAQLVLAFLTYVEDEAVGVLTAALASAGDVPSRMSVTINHISSPVGAVEGAVAATEAWQRLKAVCSASLKQAWGSNGGAGSLIGPSGVGMMGSPGVADGAAAAGGASSTARASVGSGGGGVVSILSPPSAPPAGRLAALHWLHQVLLTAFHACQVSSQVLAGSVWCMNSGGPPALSCTNPLW